MDEHYLIVGLGNPGKAYEDTRHNIGFRIVKALASKYGMSFRPSLVRSKGSLGKGKVQEKQVQLLMPLTYMNESGASVKKTINYCKVPMDHLIIVTDDADLPLGKIRLRSKGSCGGHNGLRSIETYLGTQEYLRLRIGVGRNTQGELADYVLDKFTAEEQEVLTDIIDRAIQVLELWITKGLETASNKVGEKINAESNKKPL